MSNNYTLDDYQDQGIILNIRAFFFRRGGAHKEYILSKTRLGGALENFIEEAYSL
jgi:hypothetical protein